MERNDDELLRAARDAAVRESEARGERAPETASAERVERLERVLGFALWPLAWMLDELAGVAFDGEVRVVVFAEVR
jgi:hypothetical protein